MSIIALFCEVTDNRKPFWGLVSEGRLHGSLYGDRGYISKDLRERLHKQGVNLVYKVRKNMKPLEVSVSNEVLLKKRMLIESVIRVMKTQTQMEHTFIGVKNTSYKCNTKYHTQLVLVW